MILNSESKDVVNPKKDPILLWLLNQDSHKSADGEQTACQNLSQVIEYVS